MVLRSLEEDEVDDNAEVEIAILTPNNANGNVTDEDSGDEEYVSVNNLPASQLLAEAEILHRETDDGEDLLDNDTIKDGNLDNSVWDEEDDIPIHYFKILKKSYNWEDKDLQMENENWSHMITVTNNASPTELFSYVFDDAIIDMFELYINEYALKKNQPANITKEEIKCFLVFYF